MKILPVALRLLIPMMALTISQPPPPDAMNGETDIPGHEWVKVGENSFSGRLSNRGAFGAPSFWSSDAGNGQLIYSVVAIVDDWNEVKALHYYSQGFAQYSRLLNGNTQEFHPTEVVWLKHVAVKNFRLDGAGVLAIFPEMEAL